MLVWKGCGAEASSQRLENRLVMTFPGSFHHYFRGRSGLGRPGLEAGFGFSRRVSAAWKKDAHA